MPKFHGVIDRQPYGRAVLDTKSQHARVVQAKPSLARLQGEVSYTATDLFRGMPLLPWALWITYPESQTIPV